MTLQGVLLPGYDHAMMRIPRPAGTLNFLLAWLIPWRPAFRTRAKNSKLVFYAHFRDIIGRHIGKYGVHEPRITQWMADYLSAAAGPGMVVDVGANLGWHAVHAAQYAAVETVVAFEPDLFNAQLLDRNLTANKIDKVVVSTCAVGAQSGIARLHRYRGTNYGRHSLLTDYGYGSRLVPLRDLDSALESLGLSEQPILVLKIDVEGYEPAVIEGARRTLTRTQAIALEYSPDLVELAAMVDALHAAGFAPYVFKDDRRITEIALDDLRKVGGQTDVIWINKKLPVVSGAS